MKYQVNDGCIGCGLCASTCPNVFHMGDEGKAEAIKEAVNPEDEADAETAMNNCPVSAIEKVED
jgi:ferredoxin